MTRDHISRLAITAPVTALLFDGDHNMLYMGSGGQLLVYKHVGITDGEINAVRIGPVDVFDTHSIHGIKVMGKTLPKVVIFGGKAASVATIKTRVDSIDHYDLNIDFNMQNLDDLVLDCTAFDDLLLIGFAHNFIDILSEDKKDGKYARIRRVQCTDISALFSLSIVTASFGTSRKDCSNVLVASGTAFGKIILWNFDATREEKPIAALSPTVRASDILTGHEGVIFRLQWSKDRSKLVSVSDDRTVRVWDVSITGKGIQTFIGWGHISRLWDVLFLGELEDKIATSSEDGTIKVWALKQNECVVTLRGHASDVWCLTSCSSRDVGFQNDLLLAVFNLHSDEANKNVEDDDEQLVLFSGGNDGSVKAWPLTSHAISSPENPSASLNRFAIPRCPLQEAAIGASSRRSNGISSLKLSEDGQWSVICMCNGGIWIVNFSGLIMTASDNGLSPNDDEPPSSRYGGRERERGRGRGSNPSWHYLGCCDKAVTTADTYFSNEFSSLYDRNGEMSMFTSQSRLFASVVCAHPDGLLTLLEVSAYYKPSEDSFEISSERCTWKVHDVRAINVWYACIEEISMESMKNYLITTSVKGVCRLWGPGQGQGQSQGQGLGSSVNWLPYNLLSEFVTGKGQVATCCMLQKSLLIVGDTRGGISIFNISEEMLSNSQETSSGAPVSPHIFIPSAHGVDLVSFIVANDETGGFFSVGHDGNFNVYDSAGQLTNKLKCLPIKSPDQIHLSGSGNELSIYIGGYLGGQYLVYDIRKGYQVMKIEGGGWKRSHHAVLYVQDKHLDGSWNFLPRVVFICSAPCNNDTSLLHCDTSPEYSTRFIERDSTAARSQGLSNVPLHLGVPSHGKVSYCAKILLSHYSRITEPGEVAGIIRDVFVVVGGEDGNVKLISNSQKIRTSLIGSNNDTRPQMMINSDEDLSQGNVNSDGREYKNTSELIQEISMPGHASVKAIAFAAKTASKSESEKSVGSRGTSSQQKGGGGDGDGDVGKEGIMIAVGGRLAYSIWEYSLNKLHTEIKEPLNKDGCNYRNARSLLSALTSGTVTQKMNQDHRILCVQCVNISTTRTSAGEVDTSSSSSCSSSSSDSGSRGEDVYLIVLGDSRGIATVATYTHGHRARDNNEKGHTRCKNRLETVQELQIHRSGCPVLSCSVTVLRFPCSVSWRAAKLSAHSDVSKDQTDGLHNAKTSTSPETNRVREDEVVLYVGIFGDTAGVISVWLLPGSVVPSNICDTAWDVLEKCLHLFSYQAHAMGANAVSTIQLANQSTSTNTVPDPAVAVRSSSPFAETRDADAKMEPLVVGPSWHLMITSGGDDQAICICNTTLRLKDTEASMAVVEVEYAYKRADGCSGSAVKGIQTLLIRPTSAPSTPALPFCGSSHSPDCDGSTSHSSSGYQEKQNGEDLSRIIITSVGYDQRLSMWCPRPFRSTLVSTIAHVSLDIASDKNEVFLAEDDTGDDVEDALFSNVADITRTRDELLEWVAGLAIHIGDVCALDTCLVTTVLTAHDSKANVYSGGDITDPVGAYLDEFIDSEITMIVVGEGFQLLTATV